jgi:hypothetical protein
VVGLRLHPPYRVMAERGFVEPGPRAELVAQSWTFELAAAQTLEPSRVTLELPNEPGPGRIGKPDPWYELAGAEVAVVVTARGALRRAPGAVVGKLEPWEPYYAERWDGTIDAAKAISGDVGHTFLMRPAEPG